MAWEVRLADSPRHAPFADPADVMQVARFIENMKVAEHPQPHAEEQADEGDGCEGLAEHWYDIVRERQGGVAVCVYWGDSVVVPTFRRPCTV